MGALAGAAVAVSPAAPALSSPVRPGGSALSGAVSGDTPPGRYLFVTAARSLSSRDASPAKTPLTKSPSRFQLLRRVLSMPMNVGMR